MCVDVFAHLLVIGGLIIALEGFAVGKGSDERHVIAAAAVHDIRTRFHREDFGDDGLHAVQLFACGGKAVFGITELEQNDVANHTAPFENA